jgi:hypothetical protein
MAGFLTVSLTADGLHLERGVENWKVRRPQRWGVSSGLVWGPMRRPLSPPGVNPWKERASLTLRLPWLIGPWFYVWKYKSEQVRNPARFYVGFKLIEAGDPPDDVWARDSERGQHFMTPSFSIRTRSR